MEVAVVVNPVAGAGLTRPLDRSAIEQLVARQAAKAGCAAETFFSAGPGGVRAAARGAVDRGATLVVAWGGDGTVNEVASALVATKAVMGVVPAGSGNGLARELGLPRRPERALRRAFERHTRLIDVGTVGQSVFVNVAGFGFDAHVAERFNAGQASRGLLRYLRVVLTELPRYRPATYTVRLDQASSFVETALLVGCANSRQYGNGAVLAPDARLDDGWLDLVIVRPTSVMGDLLRARRFFTGGLAKDRHVRFARFQRARIECADGLAAHVDGERVGSLSNARDVSVCPGALRVCV